MATMGEPRKENGLAMLIGIGKSKPKAMEPERDAESISDEEMDPIDVALDEAYDARSDRTAWKEAMRSVVEQICYRCAEEREESPRDGEDVESER